MWPTTAAREHSNVHRPYTGLLLLLLPPAVACVRMLCLQLSDMELSKQQGNVMAALKQGNEALKKAQQEVQCVCVCYGWLAG